MKAPAYNNVLFVVSTGNCPNPRLATQACFLTAEDLAGKGVRKIIHQTYVDKVYVF
jgi:hypothetical protein